MSENLNIETSVRFDVTSGVPSAEAIGILKILNAIYYKSELIDLYAFKKEYPDIPKAIFDATEFRMRRERESAILIRSINRGSVEFVVVGTGLMIWFLQQTIGETIKEAWLDSKWHKALKDFLLNRRFEKKEMIEKESSRAIRIRFRTDIDFDYQNNREDIHIHYHIRSHEQSDRAKFSTPDEFFNT
jgi:hypothetical protein